MWDVRTEKRIPGRVCELDVKEAGLLEDGRGRTNRVGTHVSGDQRF